MPDNHIRNLLDELEHKTDPSTTDHEMTVRLSDADLIRLQALAEVFNLSPDDLGTSLLHTVLSQVEEKLPYRPGPKVIRVEDDDPIYEDVGPTPRYLEIKERLQEKHKRSACA